MGKKEAARGYIIGGVVVGVIGFVVSGGNPLVGIASEIAGAAGGLLAVAYTS